METITFDPQKYYWAADAHYGFSGSASELSEEIRSGSAHHRATELAMSNVIRRYGLAGKSVFSVGSGRAHEEYWFYRAGCSLTLMDTLQTSESVATRAALEAARMPQGKTSDQTYLVGDWFEYIAACDKPAYDVCYVSGFQPDETIRETIQSSYRARLTLQDKIESNRSWPDGMPPFLQGVMDAQKLLTDGGLLLLQSYCGGVDVTTNPQYPGLVQKQLRANGMELLELHYFTKAPAIILLAAVKGAENAAIWRRWLEMAPAITEFHGRCADADLRRSTALWEAPAERPSRSRPALAATG